MDPLGLHNLQSLERALDVAQRRHDLLAGNLARMNVAGAQRRDLDFDSALKDVERPLEDFEVEDGPPDLSKEVGMLVSNDSFFLSTAKFASLFLANLRSSFRR